MSKRKAEEALAAAPEEDEHHGDIAGLADVARKILKPSSKVKQVRCCRRCCFALVRPALRRRCVIA